MKIKSSRSDDIYHNQHYPGAYEWWYFDAIDEKSGCSFVAIWYSGFPFSPYYLSRYHLWKNSGAKDIPNPLEHSAFSFNFYQKGEEVINFIKEGDAHLFETSNEVPYAKFESSYFTYAKDHGRYELHVDFSMPSRGKTVKACFYFKTIEVEGVDALRDASSGDDTHAWIIAALSSEVTGEFIVTTRKGEEKYAFSGKGYHDHNYGLVPMGEDIHNWYWGRAHSHETDLVYYVITYKNTERSPFSILFLKENERITAVYKGLEISEGDIDDGFFVPTHSRRLMMGSENMNCKIVHTLNLDRGPFYLRFTSHFELQRDGKAPLTLVGISEFLHPGRIDSVLVRNLIKSKIWRDGKRSVMYTLYNFFNHLVERWMPKMQKENVSAEVQFERNN